MKTLNTLCMGLTAVLVTGCAPKPLYYWGSYQDQIHGAYVTPEKYPNDSQIEKLEADAVKANAANRPVPPGFHAQLGYLYALTGKKDNAQQQFELEKEQYPESGTYMDLLMQQLQPKTGVTQ